jgi:hypothetical protein
MDGNHGANVPNLAVVEFKLALSLTDVLTSQSKSALATLSLASQIATASITVWEPKNLPLEPFLLNQPSATTTKRRRRTPAFHSVVCTTLSSLQINSKAACANDRPIPAQVMISS